MISSLVYFDDPALRYRNQIKPQRHIGVRIPPLQIEKSQRMVGVVRKCIWLVLTPCCAARHAGCFIHALQCSCRVSINGDVTCTEIDHQGCSVMDPSQISHKDIIDKYPHIIVSTEFVGYLVSLLLISVSAVLLNKTGRHRQTEIVVDGYIRISRPGLALVLPS